MKTIFCQKLERELEALEEPPFPGALGEKIYQHISKEAWNMWINYQTMLINEYQLNMMDLKDREFIHEQLEKFLWGEKMKIDKNHWDYSKEKGPNCWGDLSDEFKLCKMGEKQSPINIKNAKEDIQNHLEIFYKKFPLKIKYNEHSLYVHFDEKSDEHIIFNQEKYNLIQLHFHAPSEHWLKDKVFPMEVHFVHKSTENKLLVIGVFIDEGEQSDYLEKLFKHIPFKKGEKSFDYQGALNPIELIPSEKTFYYYSGSLTTPPCSEEVNWIVMDQPITASKAQIKTFKEKVIDKNIRPVQEIYDRKITITK
ncbi:MAG: oxidative damage protection protein [Gammaproteobacteria bacterium]|nr:oxidative damage protection protein [Gammaproteobacteria bacterium]